MSDNINYEKPPASAPPPYSAINPTGAPPPDAPQYGFQAPVPQQQPYPPGYPPQSSFPAGYPPYTPKYPAQPMPGYVPPPQTTQPSSVNHHQTVIVMGGCPSCRTGVLEDEYTCCGILCAICFFPIGILCCLAMKEKRCTSCKATF